MSNRRLLELLARDGQFELMCESTKLDTVDLLSDLVEARDDSSVDIIRYVMAMRTYDLLMQVRTALALQLDEFSPAELAKLYRDLLASVQTMMAPQAVPEQNVPEDESSDGDPKARLIYRLDELASRHAIGGPNGHVG